MNEMEAEVEKFERHLQNQIEIEEIRARADVRRAQIAAKASSKMQSHDKRIATVTIGGAFASAIAILGIVLGLVACGAQDSQTAHACVAAGGQWKQNLEHSYECVR